MADKRLKIVGAMSSVPPPPADADLKLGGSGLDWDDAPDYLDAMAQSVWDRLAYTFRADRDRFRSAEREVVAAYCTAVSIMNRAAAALADAGVTVPGRGKEDAGRMVRNPAFAMYRDAAHQVRQYADVLGLTPNARHRLGIAPSPDRADSNPFSI